jgi:hypothetical protein
VRPELVPLLLVALLLVSAQAGVQSITTVVEGEQTLSDEADAVIVVDGTVTLPEGASADADVYVIGGELTIAGALSGDVTQLAGTVDIPTTGAVDGTYQVLGGERRVAEGARVQPSVIAEPFTQQRSPLEALLLFVVQTGLLAVLAFVLGRRYAPLLENVAHSISAHPLLSGTVGLLASVTLIALFVFMAFTIILIPVSVLGLLGGILVYLYAYVGLGHLLGQRVPVETPGLATAIGTVAVAVAFRVLGFVPIVGGLVSILALVVGVGAVVITYFGLREFHPPTLQPIE